jgi:hypothetical protein
MLLAASFRSVSDGMLSVRIAMHRVVMLEFSQVIEHRKCYTRYLCIIRSLWYV